MFKQLVKPTSVMLAGAILAGVAAGPGGASTFDVDPVEAVDQVVPDVMAETIATAPAISSIDDRLDLGGGVSMRLDYDVLVSADMSEPGLVVFDESHEDADTIVQSVGEDGQFRVMQVIENSNGPTEFTYELDLPEGAKAFVAGNAVIVEDAAGMPLTVLDVPWARDANGVTVPTYFEIVGTDLVQHVDHIGAAYPVVSDPIPAWAVAQILRCAAGGWLAWVSSGGWRWYWRFLAVMAGCTIGFR